MRQLNHITVVVLMLFSGSINAQSGNAQTGVNESFDYAFLQQAERASAAKNTNNQLYGHDFSPGEAGRCEATVKKSPRHPNIVSGPGLRNPIIP